MGASIDTDDSVDARDSARDAINEHFQELFDDVEDLIKRVADVQSPEIQKIRAKARVALMMAKSAIQDGATHVGRGARRAAGTTDEYLREYPWYALGAGTLLGFGLGVLVARARD
jgi:ElaB protein